MAIDEHADLIADRRQRRDQILIGLPDFAAEELHDAEDLAAQHDREAERRVQAFARRDRPAREIGVVGDIRNPHRRRLCPDAPGQADAGRERGRPAGGVEFRKVKRRRIPDPGAAKCGAIGVQDPQRAVLPAEGVADGFEDLGRGLVDAGGVEQRASGDVLSRQVTLGGVGHGAL